MPVNVNTCRTFTFYKTTWFIKILLRIFFCHFISISLCFAQRDSIDSLQKILPALKNTARIDCMNELSAQYIRLLISESLLMGGVAICFLPYKGSI